MPQSRKRPGHHENRRSSAGGSRQKVKGRTILALLFSVFGLLIAMFATMENYYVWATGAIAGAVLGFVMGKNMEKEATH